MRHLPLTGRRTVAIGLTYTQVVDAALFQAFTLYTLPARAMLHSIVADTTTAWGGTAGTLFLQVGTTTTRADLVREHDVETATLAQGGMVEVNGTIPSWSATTTISARIRSSSGNVGDGTATLLSSGVTTFYITWEPLP